MAIASSYAEFSTQHQLHGLSEASLSALMQGEFPIERGKDFLHFQQCIDEELLNHPVIRANPYTPWFAQGEFSLDQLKFFIVQFSVFSNQFLISQLFKMLSANTLEEMHASKEILANEIGVVFNDTGGGVSLYADDVVSHYADGDDSQDYTFSDGSDHEKYSAALSQDEKQFGAITGSIEGGHFRFKAAHFELLMRSAAPLGLGFNDLGKRKFGCEQTLFFCDELCRLYGSDDYQTAAAASYAVENWAAAGFWGELISGMKAYKERHHIDNLPITFFTWHNKLEANHARHTQEELESYYFSNDVDERRFIHEGNEMLDGVYTFWRGLDSHRHLH
ncbi:MAG: hypothetical protein HRU20_04470 [Pseudomonadales bacterium]|nr:hypothetical protein [Pseudomonadales bacterium]